MHLCRNTLVPNRRHYRNRSTDPHIQTYRFHIANDRCNQDHLKFNIRLSNQTKETTSETGGKHKSSKSKKITSIKLSHRNCNELGPVQLLVITLGSITRMRSAVRIGPSTLTRQWLNSAAATRMSMFSAKHYDNINISILLNGTLRRISWEGREKGIVIYILTMQD